MADPPVRPDAKPFRYLGALPPKFWNAMQKLCFDSSQHRIVLLNDGWHQSPDISF